MKKLLFTFITILSLGSFAQEEAASLCPAGDRDCENLHLEVGGSTIQTGIDCGDGTCRQFEKSSGAMLSNNRGVLVTSDGQPVMTSGSESKKKAKGKK